MNCAPAGARGMKCALLMAQMHLATIADRNPSRAPSGAPALVMPVRGLRHCRAIARQFLTPGY